MLSDYPARYWSDLSAVQLKLETAFGASSVPPKAVHSAATSRHPLQLGRAGVNVLSETSIRLGLTKLIKSTIMHHIYIHTYI